MKALTKTEQKLMAEVSRIGQVSVTMADRRGVREFEALKALIDRGLLVRVPEGCASDKDFTKNKARRTVWFHTLTGRIA